MYFAIITAPNAEIMASILRNTSYSPQPMRRKSCQSPQPPNDGADVGPSDTTEHLVYNRLRADGWIMEVVNRRAIEVHMPREAHALLSSLMALKEELRVDISAEASLIESAHWHGGFAAKMQRRSNRKN